MKKVTVMFIPHYVKKSLDINKISLTDLEDITNYDSSYEDKEREREVKRDMLSKIPKRDLRDLQIVNSHLTSKLNVNTEHWLTVLNNLDEEYPIYEDVSEDEVNRIYNLLIDYDIKHENSYELIMVRKVVFVILKDGFTNFIILKDEKDKFFFYKTLLDFMFKYFNYFDVIDTSYFKNFLFYNFKKQS